MGPVFAYIVLPTIEIARKLGRKMVDEQIVACVNILPGMQAIYRWEGRIEDANEVVMIAKSTAERFSDIVDFMALEHPYDVPCIVALPLVDGEATYMKWIVDNSGAVPIKRPPVSFDSPS
jgi:periplasmic divalent cation tolerance protein